MHHVPTHHRVLGHRIPIDHQRVHLLFRLVGRVWQAVVGLAMAPRAAAGAVGGCHLYFHLAVAMAVVEVLEVLEVVKVLETGGSLLVHWLCFRLIRGWPIFKAGIELLLK